MFNSDYQHWKSNCKCNYMQALPFSDALKLLSYLKNWILNPDKVFRDLMKWRSLCCIFGSNYSRIFNHHSS